ncbi:saccharopine dehydrogenase NADP-binding domain-containing protein [Couchioplanes caeruleus]|uniref:saccharopine dehydrogenase family protein n=1 Tax=Couchioplanes caeruleus TaxID=56438 RepID=UPI00201BE309|nr:saccharopine dehydrogenase NADP-binding domain-containing protein [Couchioplanes caeruleus]UQU61932.1 saccharopine dehydrogenase NADP-binding domain-containing protein [Couchioplanes caeruleus]
MRAHDIVVYGATGFVGALVAEYLAGHAPEQTRIALAGRSAERLEAVRRRLGVQWPIIVADASDEAALADLAAATRVVISTVGPYAKYGRALVHACAATSTDYVDLTGEVLFVRTSIDDNHDLARSTGARIVHSCGFDSIPSDIGVHVLHGRAAADGAGELTDTTLVVTALRGGFSGGTIDSMRHQLDTVAKDRELRRIAASPYSLTPDRGAEPDLGRQDDLVTLPGEQADPSLRGTLAPFVMASYNTRVVRRSNALRDYAYGRTFRYRETMSTGRSPLSPVLAAGTKVGLAALVLGLRLPPTRFVLDRVLPKPGEGPDERTRREGHFTVDIFSRTTTGARYTARFRAKGDPGYAATALMLAEAALALVHDREALPPSPGGVLTPATGIGDALVNRLRAAGVEITARALTGAATR